MPPRMPPPIPTFPPMPAARAIPAIPLLPAAPPPPFLTQSTPPKTNIFARIGMGIVIVVAGVIGKVVVREAMKPSPRTSYDVPEIKPIPPLLPPSSRVVPPSNGWGRRDVAGVSLELPGTPRATSFTVPPKLATMVDKAEQYQLGLGSSVIIVAHMRYNREIMPSLNGAAAGAIQGMRDQPDVSNFSSNEAGATVDGLAARRFKVLFRKSQYDLANESLTVLRDRDLWIISVVGRPGDVTPLADRIMANVHLL